MAEGFHVPDAIDLPFDLDHVLHALIRVPTHHQYAIVSVFESRHDKETFVPNQGSKSFLPEGVALWHLALTRADLRQIGGDPGVRLRPLLYEAVQAFHDVETFPGQRIVPLEVAALGFFVSPDGDFVTNYYVVGEEIEAAGRTAGSDETLVCRYTSFEIPIIHERQIREWVPLDPVCLVRNPSSQGWHDGFDTALLRADLDPPDFLRLAKRAPRIGESVWVFGLPVRSARPKSRGYENADGKLRVSAGTVVEIQDHTFITDADSFNGYSGGPVRGADGAVLGINWNVYSGADTIAAEARPRHVVLNITKWTIEKNDAWIQSVIDQRGTVCTAPPLTQNNLWDAVNARSTVFGREVEQLLSAGYQQVGDYLVPRP